MSKHTINIVNETETLNGNIKKCNGKGFLFRYDGNSYIISVHHFMSIKKTYLNIEGNLIELKKAINICWNELNIFEAPRPDKSNLIISKFYNNQISIKSCKTRFPNFKSSIKMEINNKFEQYALIDYEYIKDEYSELESIYLKFYICKEEDGYKGFPGLSGSPIYSNDNNLIGVFCSINIQKNKVFGLFLPTVYIVKSLQRKDNEHIYNLDTKYDVDLKIGNFEIQKNVQSLHNHERNDYVIYHFTTNFKLKINAFLNLEGDENKSVLIKNNTTQEIVSINYEKYNSFDININVMKNDENKFKINNGFVTLLSKNGYNEKLHEMHAKYSNKRDLWLSLKELEITN